MEDALAAGRRLWLRGQLLVQRDPSTGPVKTGRWWERWSRKAERAGPPPPLRLETRIGGTSLETEIALSGDGRFEALLEGDLPAARRGWRMARNRVRLEERTAEKCSVVSLPPEDARGAVVVVLPLDCTSAADGAQRLARSELAAGLTAVLRQLQLGPSGVHALYYLACVPPEADSRHAELALAATTLGWPHGNFVCLAGEGNAASEVLSTGVDRLRWLFHGTTALTVFNLEPALANAFAFSLHSREDRADVRRLLNPGTDPRSVFDGPAAGGSRAPGLRPTRANLVPRYPVVFCHGMLALSTLRMKLPEDRNCFSPLRAFLGERGCRAFFPQVTPTGGVAARAQELKDQLLRWTDEPVNVIAHSMGGLDARYLITHLGMADRVKSLTTVATPHQGTYLADWFQNTFRKRVPLLIALEALGVNVDGFRDCQLAACRAFNERTPNRPEVRYFSFGGAVPQSRVSPMLRRAWNLLTPVEGTNDGMVSTASARWGEYLGTVHADHYAQTPDSIFLRPGEDFDSLSFYCRLVEDLARRGY
jgi:triacylglycerol lipase